MELARASETAVLTTARRAACSRDLAATHGSLSCDPPVTRLLEQTRPGQLASEILSPGGVVTVKPEESSLF